MKYFKKILNVAISVFIFIGIPYFFGWGYVFVTWIPSVLVFNYLDEEIDNFKIKNSFNFFQGKNNQIKYSEGGITCRKVYYLRIKKFCNGGCGKILEYETKIDVDNLSDNEIVFCDKCKNEPLNKN